LNKSGVIQKQHGYFLSDSIAERIYDLRVIDRLRQERYEDTVNAVEKILDHIPLSERRGLTSAQWLKYVQEDHDISFADAIDRDNQVFFEMRAELDQIERMIFKNGSVANFDLGLPIVFERERQLAARQMEAEKRREAQIKANLDASVARQEKLINSAASCLGGDADAWINTVSQKIGGRTPLEAAALSETAFNETLPILFAERDRRFELFQREKEAERFRVELRREAYDNFGVEKGKCFLVSPYPEIDKRKPIEYCKSLQTLEKCKDLMKKLQHRKRR
jgi:uncharacterized protein (DUF2384 family)